MSLIVDSHQDLAWNMLAFGRDYTRSAHETRQQEHGRPVIAQNDDTLLGWPEYQRGHVSLIFSTLFSPPARWALDWETYFYTDTRQARQHYSQQLDIYYRLTDDHPDKFQLVTGASTLENLVAGQQQAIAAEQSYPVGLLPLMEGADCIEHPDELEEWWERGLRVVGPAWAGTRYCGGTKEPGPLTKDGRRLLETMADLGFSLDLSHMDEAAVLGALDIYDGPIIATHANCQALLPNSETNRHLSDRVIQGILERDGIIGIVLYNSFIKDGWLRPGSPREEVTLEHLVAHIDHICQMAGDARHVGIGSDFDGGFGLQSIPIGIDTIADLPKLSGPLMARGYSQADADAVLGLNWLNYLRRNLPQ